MGMSRILVVLAVCLVCVSHVGEAKDTIFSACEPVFEYFPYCLEFLMGDPNFPVPSTRCCKHVAKLNTLAHSNRTGPRTICWCIEVMVRGMTPAMEPSKIQDLPLMCNTTLSFPISDSMDCSK
uniref:Non-specific lipid-transfer protein 13 n=2 Tax=Cajanus cajan TaxID=3821 RepID=A0A151SF19_CAJCA|nr:Non-specific lipid-transfer protein 13 [Cajanus cajan]